MWVMWCIGVVVHMALLISVKDVFVVPGIQEGVEPGCPDWGRAPPAERLVLIVADGLRSDVLYRSLGQASEQSFLRRVMRQKGCWGVARGRAPTLCTPGILALTAGLNQRPPPFSILPISQPGFDHLFNRSTATFYFGDPRVPDIYSKSPSVASWYKFTYPIDWIERRRDADITVPDTWVFDRVLELLGNATGEVRLGAAVGGRRVVFFLHLRGPEAAGHLESSSSVRTLSAVKNIDRGIARVAAGFEQYFTDGRTAFALVSDHGFSEDWYRGRHGGGSPEELGTPVLAWGSGLAGPIPPASDEVESPADWNVSDIRRRDIEQVDVAPLLSALLGLAVPAHSTGVLPEEYLNITDDGIAMALACNAFQIANLCRATSLRVDTSGVFSVKEVWSPLRPPEAQKKKSFIKDLIKNKNFLLASDKSRELIRDSSDGIRFYQNYYQSLASWLLFIIFFGWGLSLLLKLVLLTENSGNEPAASIPRGGPDYRNNVLNSSLTRIRNFIGRSSFCVIVTDAVFCLIILWPFSLISGGKTPSTFYAYAFIATILWWYLIRNAPTIFNLLVGYKTWISRSNSYHVLVQASFAELVMLVVYDKLGLTIAFVLFLLYNLSTDLQVAPTTRSADWLVSSLLLIILPFYTTFRYPFNRYLFLAGGLSWLAFGSYFLRIAKVKGGDLALILVLFCLLTASIINAYIAQSNMTDSHFVTCIISWNLLITSNLVPPFLGSSSLLLRLFEICFCVCIPFALMTVRHESLALLSLVLHLGYWMYMELHDKYDLTEGLKAEASELPRDQKKLDLSDMRRSLLYFVYLVYLYYVVGLTDSTARIDSRWFRTFAQPELGSYPPAVCVLLKAGLTFLLVTSFFICYLRLSKSSTQGFLFMSLFFANMLGLHALVAALLSPADDPIRLETSVCHYIMSQTLPLLMLVLFPASLLFTGSSFIDKFLRNRQHSRRRSIVVL